MSIVKTASASVAAGGQLTYTLDFADSGQSTASSVSVHDQLPAGMTYVSSRTSRGICDYSSGTLTCVHEPLANGAAATVTITVHATFAPAGTSVPNTATVTSSTNDDDLAADGVQHGHRRHAARRAVVRLGGADQGLVLGSRAGRDMRDRQPRQRGGRPGAAGDRRGERPRRPEHHNTAAVSSDTTEIAPAGNTDDATTAAIAPPAPPADDPAPAPAPPPAAEPGNLSVTKTADAGATVALGHGVTFTIRVSNDTDRTAHGVLRSTSRRWARR